MFRYIGRKKVGRCYLLTLQEARDKVSQALARTYIRKDDITSKNFIGRTTAAHSDHPGNVAYRLALVDQHKERHNSLPSNDPEKTEIRDMIVITVMSENARFLEEENGVTSC